MFGKALEGLTSRVVVRSPAFLELFEHLRPSAKREIRTFLNRLQENPYSPEIVQKYQSDFDHQLFTKYSSLGYALTWQIETDDWQQSPSAISETRIIIADFTVTGMFLR